MNKFELTAFNKLPFIFKLLNMKCLFALFLVLSICINCFAQGKFPNKKQFAVKCEDGTVFELDTDIKNVYEKLGEPLRKENLWAIYPEASCAFYKIDYEGISFCYYDIDNIIARIIISTDTYKIVDNDISIGSNFDSIIKSYGSPHRQNDFFNEEKKLNEIQIGYSTRETELSYIKQTVLHYYNIAFNFDDQKEKCNQIILNFYRI